MANLPTPVDGKISLAQLNAWAQEFDRIGPGTPLEFLAWLRLEVEPHRSHLARLRDEDSPRSRLRRRAPAALDVRQGAAARCSG